MELEPRIRVLVTAFAPVPGSNAHAADLAGLASALRAELDLVTLKTESLPHLEHFGTARMFRVPVTGSPEEQRAGFGRAIGRQLDAQPYDVVQVRGPFEGRAVLPRHRELGFRFVYEVATFPDEAEGPGAEADWHQAHTECLEAADLILVPTQAASRALSERGYGGKVAVVHPGVDIEMFDWWPSVPDDVVRLMYLGSFAADRDLGTLLGAVRRVTGEHPVRVLVAGEPEPERRARLRRMVTAFELDGIVEVRGEPRATALPSLIAACDIGLVPAAESPRFQEGGDLPQPLLEYLACRRPVVAAGVPGVSEVVRDEKEGLLYLPGDETILAEAIETLLSQHTMRARLVESAYDRVRWEFSSAARRRRMAEVYEMLMPGSQDYDAWQEGFDDEATGELPMPDSNSSLRPTQLDVWSSGRVPEEDDEDMIVSGGGAERSLASDAPTIPPTDGDLEGEETGVTTDPPAPDTNPHAPQPRRRTDVDEHAVEPTRIDPAPASGPRGEPSREPER
jgi:glycosyltransferase involved in cell wall biosynthesis